MARLITGYLLEAAARRRDELLRKIERGRLKAYVEEAERLWNRMHSIGDPPSTLAGVDGSSGNLDFKGFTLYAVTGVSHSYDNMEGSYRLRHAYRLIDVDVLEPPLVAERIGVYREILEAKAGLRVLGSTEVLLMDGSLVSALIKPAPFEQASLPEAVSMARHIWGPGIFDKLLEAFEESLPETRDPIASKRLVGALAPGGRGYINAVILLEYLEKLLSYKALLEERKQGVLIGFLSKTSRSHLYFEEQARRMGRHPPPDIYVFETLDPPPGFSEPRMLDAPKFLPDELGLAGFYRSVKVAVSYVRLVEGGPIMRLEIPFADKSSVESLIRMLAAVSPDGYPHPLYEAHIACKITRRDLVDAAHVLGIDVELTGREVLGEWL